MYLIFFYFSLVRGAKSSRFKREHNEHYHSDQSRNSRAKAYER